MIDQLFLSVVTPVYNGEIFLKENFNSWLNQTHQNFEVIYIDDGSTDNSLRIISDITSVDNRFRLYHQKHKGISNAIQKGVLKAKSPYIILMDQDDVAMPNRLKLTARAFCNGAELIMGDYEVTNEKLESTGKVITLPNHINNKNILLEQIKRSYILGSALAFKNKNDFSFLKESGGATDFDISLKMLLRGYHFSYIPEVLIKYRVHTKNTSANYRNQKKDITKVINQFTPEEFVTSLRERSFNYRDIYLSLGIMYLFQEDIDTAKHFLSKIEISLLENHSQTFEEFYFYKGVLEYKQQNLLGSHRVFEQLLEISRNPSIFNNLGYFKVYQGDLINAKKFFSLAKELNSDYLDAIHNLNECIKGTDEVGKFRFTTRLLREKLTHKSIIK